MALEERERGMTGYIRNCFLLPRGGDQLFNAAGLPTLDGYAIIPMEVFDAIGGSLHPACKFPGMWMGTLDDDDKRRNGDADQEDLGPDAPAG
jgi:hypothetical protein